MIYVKSVLGALSPLFGRRLWKKVDGITICFLYSDEGLVGEYDASGVEIRSYGYKPYSTWITDPLFLKEGESYYQGDFVGAGLNTLAMLSVRTSGCGYTST
jgi:hypothetical protein